MTYPVYIPEEPIPPVSRRGWIKKVLPPILLIILIAAAVLGILRPGRSGAFLPGKSSWQVIPRPWESDLAILQDGRFIASITDVTITGQLSSLDGRVSCLHTSDGALYLLRNGKCIQIADRIFYMALSRDGSSLACINENLWLTVYNTANLESTRIDKNVYGASLSPNGDALAYYTMDNKGKTTAYLYTGKEPTLLSTNRIPFALSNRGKQIYCLSDQTGSLYCLNSQGENRKLASDLDRESTLLLNADHTQLIFSAGSDLWISVKGSDRQSIGSGALTMVLPAGREPASRFESGFRLMTLPASDLRDHYYINNRDLCRMERNWNLSVIGQDVLQAYAADGGRLVWYFQADSNLSYGPVLGGSYSNILAGVGEFAVSPDGKALWFKDSSGALWYREERSTPKLLTEKAGSIAVTKEGSCIFSQDGKLYESIAGAAAVPVSATSGTVLVTPTATYILSDSRIWVRGRDGSFSPVA